jgi:hypothetical protein
VSGLVGDRLTQRLLVVRRVLGVESAGVEEEARGKGAGENGDHDGDGDADTGGEEREQVEFHVSSILPPPRCIEVGPKVTTTLGRPRLLGLVGRDSRTPKIVVVSGNPDVREGWGAHCPLLDEADAAYYDNTCVTEDLAADLIERPRLLPIFIAHDKPTLEGDQVPQVSRAI